VRLPKFGLLLIFSVSAAAQVTTGASAVATFIQADTTTAGNWKGVYGADGNIIAQSSVAVPSYATFNTAGAINLNLLDLWATDPRALLKQSYSYSPTERVESYFFTPSSLDLLITAPTGQLHRIALYFANYRSEARSQSLQAIDTSTGAVLDSRAVPNADGGVYLVYNYSGAVTFRLTNTLAGGTAALSGLFWDGPAVTSNPPSDTTPPTVAFFEVPKDGISTPFNITAAATDNVGVASVQFYIDGVAFGAPVTSPAPGTSLYQIFWDNTTATRGVHTLQATAKDAAGNTASDHSAVTLTTPTAPVDTTPPTVAFFNTPNDGIATPFSLVVGATDNVGIASVQFYIDDVAFGAPVTSPSSGTSFYGIFWDNRTATRGLHLLKAIAKDAAGNSATALADVYLLPQPASVSPNSATFVAVDSATLGNWKGVYGKDGNVIAQHSVTVPSYATFDTGGAINLQLVDLWATNPWALLKQTYSYSPTERIESYFLTQVSMDFRIGATDGQTHQIAFYFADYEKLGRLSQIQAIDAATGTALDTRRVTSAYLGPVYLVYAYTGNIIFRVTRLVALPDDSLVPAGAPGTGPSAAVSGIFWGPVVSPVPPQDTTAPVVAIQSPTDGQTVHGTITLAASATDNVGVAQLNIRVDGITICATTQPPFQLSCPWNSAQVFDGKHAILVEAIDAAQNSGVAAVGVTVANHPALTIVSPASGATVSGLTILSANITSAAPLQSVVFQVDGVAVGSPPVAGPAYGMTWDSTTKPNGPHTFTVVVIDVNNNQTSAVGSFNISNGGTTGGARSVSITSPANGATVSGTVTVVAALTGDLKSVGWEVDGSSFPTGSFVSGTVTSVTVDTTRMSNGPHNITAFGSNLSDTTLATTITVIVNNVPSAGTPQVTFVRMDTTTKGNWKGVYGQDGNFIAEFSYAAPAYSTFNAINTNRFLIDLWSTDPRAPLKPQGAYSPTERVMSHWSTPAAMDFQVSASDGQPHRIAVYFADWQPLAAPAAFGAKRMIHVQVLDTSTGIVLAENGLSDYTGGIYLVYDYRGSVTFRIVNMSNPLSSAATQPDANVSAFLWGQ
jgi:hypothetical protein